MRKGLWEGRAHNPLRASKSDWVRVCTCSLKPDGCDTTELLQEQPCNKQVGGVATQLYASNFGIRFLSRIKKKEH